MEKVLDSDFNLYAISRDFKRLDKNDLVLLNKILKSGYLYSRNQLGISTKRVGFNGVDYISLCDYSLRNSEPYNNMERYKGYTAYNSCIEDSISLILKKGEYKVVKPILTYPHVFGYEDVLSVDVMGRSNERYSDFPDEVQVKDKLDLINLIGIFLPISYNLKKNRLMIDNLYEYLAMLEKILSDNEKNIGIYDLDIDEKINTENFEKVYKKRK